MAERYQILLIDGLQETEEVLRTVLKPRGWEVRRVRFQDLSASSSDEGEPDVIIYHRECEQNDERTLRWESIPKIVIESESERPMQTRRYSSINRFCKPFEYRELILAIEELLKNRSATQVEQRRAA